MADEQKLAPRLGLAALVLYGVGDILGAGIYALAGKVVGVAGTGAWASFLMSATLAGLTGFTYAELSSRIPRAGGAAAYVEAAFNRPLATFVVGFLVLASGLTSTATVSLAFQGYLGVFVSIPAVAAAVIVVAVISVIAYRGIHVSAWTNNFLTGLEAAGLLIVIAGGAAYLAGPGTAASGLAVGPDLGPLVAGATLAFYAFIGFEDLANLAEDARNPRRDLPRAILAAVGISTALYLAVIVIVTLTLGPARAGASSRPLLDVLTAAGAPVPAGAFAILAIFAVTNTGLANFVMVTRLLYGLSRQSLLPGAFARVHPVHRTPWVAVLWAAALTLALAGTGGVKLLAQTTSLLLVIVFGALHAAAIRLRRSRAPDAGAFRAPAFVPWAGLAACAYLGLHFPAGAYTRAAAVAAVAAAVHFSIRRPPWRR